MLFRSVAGLMFFRMFFDVFIIALAGGGVSPLEICFRNMPIKTGKYKVLSNSLFSRPITVVYKGKETPTQAVMTYVIVAPCTANFHPIIGRLHSLLHVSSLALSDTLLFP